MQLSSSKVQEVDMKKSKLLSYYTNGTFNFNIWGCLSSSKPATLFTHIKLNVYCKCCQFWLNSSNYLTEKCCVCLGVCNRETDERRMVMRWQIWLFWTFWLKTQRCQQNGVMWSFTCCLVALGRGGVWGVMCVCELMHFLFSNTNLTGTGPENWQTQRFSLH